MVETKNGEEIRLSTSTNLALLAFGLSMLTSVITVLSASVKVHDWLVQSGVEAERRHEQTQEMQNEMLVLQKSILTLQEKEEAQETRVNTMEENQARQNGLPVPPVLAPKIH